MVGAGRSMLSSSHGRRMFLKFAETLRRITMNKVSLRSRVLVQARRGDLRGSRALT